MTEHSRCTERLPWYVNGTLSGSEVREVEDHLAHCEDCRRELERCRALAALYEDVENLAPAPHPSRVARLWARLGEVPRRTPGSPWRWVALAEAVAILALLAFGVTSSRNGTVVSPPTFRTLGDHSENAPTLDTPTFRVVFAPPTAEETIRSLLLSLEAEIVAGPSPRGVYTLEAAPVDEVSDWPTLVLETLRRDPAVLFAERATGPEGTP